MRRLNCGCLPPKEEQVILPLKVVKSYNVHLPNTTDKTCELKFEIIADLKDILQSLECGLLPDLKEILEEMSILEMNNTNYMMSKLIFPKR